MKLGCGVVVMPQAGRLADPAAGGMASSSPAPSCKYMKGLFNGLCSG